MNDSLSNFRHDGDLSVWIQKVGWTLLASLTVAMAMPQVACTQDAATSPGKPAASTASSDTKAAAVKQPVITEQELKEVSDRLILLAVQDEMLRSEAIDGHRIDVDVDDGIVTLSGLVNNILTKQIAVGLAERIRGTVSVIDEIEINVKRRDDAALQSDVQAAVQHDPATRHLKVDVKAESGTVTLSGSVPTTGEKTLAGEVAMGVKGVEELENDLTVVHQKTLSDDDLKSEIQELFRYSALLDDCEIGVTVKAGVAVLNGKVASPFQKSHADFVAFQAGAKEVDSRGIHVHWTHTNPLLRSQRYVKATDEEIRDAIQRTFQHDPRLLSFTPEVQVEHGVVTLTGDVGHLTAKRSAERDAQHTIGVHRVKNLLNVRWPDKPPTDEQIANFTRAAMTRDPYVERHNLNIECQNAHVSLYGIVDTQFEKYHAEWIASRQQGVVHVNDYLAVRRKWTPKSDAAIQADLDDKLAWAFVGPDQQVKATVKNGVALLTGTVDTWMMWQTAIDQALAAGAREPHNMIEVRYGLPSGPHYYGPHDYVPR
ncbi:MAG: BON domain-containing protein [Rhodopirellula sp.]|nr:BON domain-containing protein [Rhodopirellula sp.]